MNNVNAPIDSFTACQRSRLLPIFYGSGHSIVPCGFPLLSRRHSINEMSPNPTNHVRRVVDRKHQHTCLRVKRVLRLAEYTNERRGGEALSFFSRRRRSQIRRDVSAVLSPNDVPAVPVAAHDPPAGRRAASARREGANFVFGRFVVEPYFLTGGDMRRRMSTQQNRERSL